MTKVRFFQDSNALDSLRNSDFDTVSAYGEVVDNSIEARAKNIQIRFFTTAADYGYQHIQRVAFADDGDGMNAETLHRCLQVGWSSRFNKRDGIGRFGVGMTLAAIHECQRVEIYSKMSSNDWLWTYIDLDENKKGKQESIPEPVSAKIPKEYKELLSDNSGTLVIWSKYDRQSANATKLIEDAIVWMGRTYRYFIWDDDVAITVDGEPVTAIDPLYARTEKTRFPNDPPAKVFDDIVFNWKVDEFDAPENAPDESPVRIKMSLLPASVRPTQGSGLAAEATKRFIQMNEGISILRNRREVFYGHIPYWSYVLRGKGWPRFEEKDRWWGCEVHFDAVLDRAFTVKNIKRGADPSSHLKKAIKTQILPTRQYCLEQVDELWAENKQNKRDKESTPEDPLGRPDDHEEAEKTAKHTPTDKNALDSEKDFDKETDDFMSAKAKNYNDEQKAALKVLFASQPFTIMEDTWQGSQFVETNFLGGKAVLRYNMSHIFFEEVYEIIESLEDDECDAHQAAKNLKVLLDLLIIAHSKGEARFPKDVDLLAEDFVENLNANWGQYLQSYVRTWKKENADGES